MTSTLIACYRARVARDAGAPAVADLATFAGAGVDRLSGPTTTYSF